VSAHRLFQGHVGHRRDGTVRHGFSYPVFFLGLDVDALDAAGTGTEAPCWPLAVDRPGLLSVRRRDYGPRDGSALGPWLRSRLSAAGLPAECAQRIVLHTFPRICGLGFNPVNFWLCLDPQGAARALLAEVSNTFGEHHSYLVAHADARPLDAGALPEARKVFHVSPFFPVEGRYRFALRHGARGVQVRILYGDGRGQALSAYLQGQGLPLSTGALLTALLHHPLQPLLVLLRIHWHALLLWRKGVRFHRKPAPPNEEISLERH